MTGLSREEISGFNTWRRTDILHSPEQSWTSESALCGTHCILLRLVEQAPPRLAPHRIHPSLRQKGGLTPRCPLHYTLSQRIHTQNPAPSAVQTLLQRNGGGGGRRGGWKNGHDPGHAWIPPGTFHKCLSGRWGSHPELAVLISGWQDCGWCFHFLICIFWRTV